MYTKKTSPVQQQGDCSSVTTIRCLSSALSREWAVLKCSGSEGKDRPSCCLPTGSFLFMLNVISLNEHKICLANSCLGSLCNHLFWILILQTNKGETSFSSSKDYLRLAKKAVSESDSQVDLETQISQTKKPLVHFPV